MDIGKLNMADVFYVYVHSRLITGEPFYIGKGKDRRARLTRGRNQYWQRIVEKDDGFHVSFLVQGVDEEFAMLVETDAIDLFRRRGCILANMTDGGEGMSGYSPTAETRAKMSAANPFKGKTGRPSPNKGKPSGRRHSEETRKKISLAGLGRPSPLKGRTISADHRHALQICASTRVRVPHSMETRAKISAAHVGKTVLPETRAKLSSLNLGKTHSDETRNKISSANKGQTRSETARDNMIKAWVRRRQCI